MRIWKLLQPEYWTLNATAAHILEGTVTYLSVSAHFVLIMNSNISVSLPVTGTHIQCLAYYMLHIAQLLDVHKKLHRDGAPYSCTSSRHLAPHPSARTRKKGTWLICRLNKNSVGQIFARVQKVRQSCYKWMPIAKRTCKYMCTPNLLNAFQKYIPIVLHVMESCQNFRRPILKYMLSTLKCVSTARLTFHFRFLDLVCFTF